LHVSCTRFWVCVSPIAKEVDVDVRNSNLLGDPEESIEMVLFGVLDN